MEEENGDAVREAKVLHASSCANHSDEPLRAKIVFSNGFHDFCVSSPLHKIEFIPFISVALPFYFIGENQTSSPGTFSIAIRKNVPRHILAPSAVACDILHLRASAHLRHAVPFIS